MMLRITRVPLVVSMLCLTRLSAKGFGTRPSFTRNLLTNHRLLPILLASSQEDTDTRSSSTMTETDEEKVVTYPEGYEVPEVWAPKEMEGKMGAINQPTAGARFEKELPRGEHPLQLYSLGTPNGQKVTILLEELGVDYDAYKISIFNQDQFGSAFVDINPNSKIPALLDYSVDDDSDEPLRVFESGSILWYLAEKEGKFIPTDIRKRTECRNWLMWQMGSAPYLGGGFGHFYCYAPMKIEYAIDRFSMEAKRIVDVLEKHLEGKEYVCGDEYTIADMAIYPWFLCLELGYKAGEFLQLQEYTNVQRWMKTLGEREAVQRGVRVNGFGPDAIEERHSIDDFKQAPSEN